MPSRKVISIFIISVALVVTIVIVTNPKNASNKISEALGGSLSAGPKVELSDSTNWEKDVQNFSLKSTAGETSSTTETLTDTFSRSFMANYLALKQSGKLDSKSAANLISKSADFIEKNDVAQYNLKDIVVSPDTSKLAITKYGNDIGFALKQNKPKGEIKNEISIFGEMMKSNDPSIKPELINIANVYQNTAIALSKVLVPSSFGSDHLKILNALNSMSASIHDMSNGIDDPIKALRGVSIYTQDLTNLKIARSNIQKNILLSGANYKQGENGYYFYFGI